MGLGLNMEIPMHMFPTLVPDYPVSCQFKHFHRFQALSYVASFKSEHYFFFAKHTFRAVLLISIIDEFKFMDYFKSRKM